MTADSGLSSLAPDLIQPVVGYRLWRLHRDGLWSPYVEDRWTRGVHTAVCRAQAPVHDDPAPGHDCSCGIYAWYEPCVILSWAATRHLVAGAVALWGEIELHPFGMRAGAAIIVALVAPPWRRTKWRRLMDVARDLDVDAVPARRLRTEALRHGAPVPEGMAPTPRATRVGYAVDQRLGARAGCGWQRASLASAARARD